MSTEDIQEILKQTKTSISANVLYASSPVCNTLIDWLNGPEPCSIVRQLHEYRSLKDPMAITASFHQYAPQTSLTSIQLNYVLRFLLPTVLSYKAKRVKDTPKDNLSADEKRAIYYVCGFVVKSLIDKYNRQQKTEQAEVLSTVITEFADWTVAQNRGGLKHVTASFFNCTLSFEENARQILVLDLRNCFLLDEVTNAVLDDNRCFETWCAIYEGDFCKEIFHDVVKNIVKLDVKAM